MSTLQANWQSRLIKLLVSRNAFDSDFTLLDVGASGGIESIWRQFEPKLSGIGIDPLISAVKRANAEEKNSKLTYRDAFVSCKNIDAIKAEVSKSTLNTIDFHMTSSVAANKILAVEYERDVFNSGEEIAYSSHTITVDDICRDKDGVDFIKTDTDGHDLYVLYGAEETLKKGVLGVQVECSLHGPVHEHANTFDNIHRFMVSLGYKLFDFQLWRYSRYSLPLPFYYDIAAQTAQGPAQWGDAVYCIDPAVNESWRSKLRPEHYVKLACIFDLYGLPDCSAQILTEMPHNLAPALVEEALDCLMPEVGGARLPYKEYMRRFRENPRVLFPSNLKTLGSPTS